MKDNQQKFEQIIKNCDFIKAANDKIHIHDVICGLMQQSYDMAVADLGLRYTKVGFDIVGEEKPKIKRYSQQAITALWENKIMMSELSNLLTLSPVDIYKMAYDRNDIMMKEDVLSIIAKHTHLSINDLTTY